MPCVFQGSRGAVESLLEKLAQMAAQEAVKATALPQVLVGFNSCKMIHPPTNTGLYGLMCLKAP